MQKSTAPGRMISWHIKKIPSECLFLLGVLGKINHSTGPHRQNSGALEEKLSVEITSGDLYPPICYRTKKKKLRGNVLGLNGKTSIRSPLEIKKNLKKLFHNKSDGSRDIFLKQVLLSLMEADVR
ncbi:hypothetical protein TNCV_3290131 [Trichonephila clavipes]|nr:hypothetical protein TNCV_3290131 [Trichonephila clavipes]